MKRIGLLSLSLMLIALVIGSASADVPAGFSLSGNINLSDNYRSKEINTFLNGKLTTSDFLLEPLITVNTKWDLKNKVTGFISFGNLGSAITKGTAVNSQFGSGLNIQPIVKQAYIKVSEFISPRLAITYGIQDLNFTLRKGDGAFFMHPASALTPSSLVKNLPTNGAYSFDADMVLRSGALNIDGRTKGLSEYSGFAVDFGAMKDDSYAVCVFWGKTMETVVTAGNVRNEDLLGGVNLAYKLLGENNVVKVLIAKMMNSAINMDIMTIGVGADYFGTMPNLEIYGEAYTQSGTFANNGTSAAGKTVDVDQSAMAYRIGGKYDFANNPLKPWVGLSYWFIDGGNDSATYKSGSVKYTENNNFVSYSDPQSTMILEDNIYGLNLNTNYTAIKVEAGITTSLTLGGEKTKLDLKLLMGMFTLNTIPWVRNPGVDGYLYGPSLDDVAQKTKDAIGTEIDIVANLHYTENLTFKLGLGMLTSGDFFGSIKVDDAKAFATSATTGTTSKDTQVFDSMTMVTFGANLKF